MAEKLEELDRELSSTASHVFPEEYIRKTLIAHGFFTHAKLLEEHRNQAKQEAPRLLGCGISEEEKRRTTQLVYHYKEGKEFHSLREPLRLQKRQQLSNRVLPKWPAEVACLDHCSVFIHDQPVLPEPLLTPDLSLVSPKIRSAHGEGTLVYHNKQGPQKFFTHSRCGPSTPEPHPRQRRLSGESLMFESRFESGNLAKAVRVGRWDYELYLRCDLYTHKHTQWFYFSVQNMKAGQTYRFTIVNLYKPSSLYNDGMQPLLHSEKRAMLHNIGWRRVGFNIKYFKTNIKRTDAKTDVNNYGLTWSYTFQHNNDTCYFAHCYPYTYTDLQEYLCGIIKDPKKSTFCKQRTLCHSIAGNPVPLLTVTSPSVSPNEVQNKRTIIVTARVHPGETNGSWMMKGMIDFLLSDSPDAQVLRDAFIFKILPMLNPDGVIVGNYRCSLSGRDLNRNYKTQLKEAYPTIWHTKELVKQLTNEREVVLYCDFHGHSRKQNVFIYGCDKVQDPSLRLRSRVFPKMLSLNAPNKFSYKGCNFKVQKSKEGTGRVFMWKEAGIINSYTMEATFCGSNLGNSQGYHFSTKELEHMGYHFCDTLLDYCDPDQSKVEYILNQLTEEYRQALVDKLQSLGVTIPDGLDPLDVEFDSDILSGIDTSDDGSDSSESDGPPMHMMDKIGKKKKSKKLQTRKERNRRKAQLKLTHKIHESPIHQPKIEQVQSTPVKTTCGKNNKSESVSSIFDESGMPANGGMPKFIQERIDERQRKDSSSISKTHEEPADYVEAVAAEYVRNGLPQSLSLQANKELQQSTASLLSQPRDCPMAISSMVLRQPSLSRMSSSSALPQIASSSADPAAGAALTKNILGSRGAFASNYVANHLKDESGPNQDLAPNNVRNLMSLSKLFRTLKPHLTGSERPHTSAHKASTIPDSTGTSPKNNRGTSANPFNGKPKKEYIGFNGEPILQRNLTHIADIPNEQGHSYIDVYTKQQQQQRAVSDDSSDDQPLKSNVLPVQEDSKLPQVSSKGGSLTGSDRTAVMADGKADSSNSIATMQSSPISVKRQLQSSSRNNLKDDSALLHLVQPPTTSLQLTVGRNEKVSNSLGNQPFGQDIHVFANVDEIVHKAIPPHAQLDSINLHKQKIATAVESIQNKRKLFKESSYQNNKRPHTSSSFSPATYRSQNLLLGYPQAVRDIQTSESSSRRKKKNRRKEDDVPQWKVYSSRSNPLYYTTTRDSKGVAPATVSLMLPDERGFTTSTSSSQAHTKQLSTRYYSNYKKGIF